MAHGGTEGELKENQRSRKEDDFFQEGEGKEDVPFCPQEAWAGADRDNAEEAEKRLGEHAVEDANFVFEERNAEAAEEALNADGDESDDGKVTNVTYKELHAKVCQFANVLKGMGVKKGDRVVIYMPMTVEGVVAMQACARIGATHSVVFGGFSAKSLQERIQDAGAVAVITANYQLRGGKELPLKAIVDEGIALGGCESIKNVIVYQRTPTACNMVCSCTIETVPTWIPSWAHR